NAATRLRDRVAAAFDAADWPALRAIASAGFVFDDRRRQSLVRGGVETWITNLGVMRSSSSRTERTLLATAGDRLAVERVVQRGAPETGLFEVEFLRLTETDASGALAASITFDPDDRRAAFDELRERWFRGEGRIVPASARAFVGAIADRDLGRARAE